MCLKVTFILLFCVFQAYTLDINKNDQYAPHISAILNHLNSNSNKIYDYKKGTFVNSQQKADIIELTIDVDVSCTVNYPEVPCTKQVLTCNGFLKYSEGAYRVLSEVSCNPKHDNSFENSDEQSTIPTLSPPESKIELSHEAVSSDQNADFVAVKADAVPCVGCPFDLNTNIEGIKSLIDTALKHIETEKNRKHVALKVIRLQRQVVAGVKYILTIEVAPTVCQKEENIYLTNCPLDSDLANSVCEIIFLQKPWLSKEKIIIRNNCTISQEYPSESMRSQRNDMNNEIDFKPYTTRQEDLNPEQLADLESQILIMDPENTKIVSKDLVESNLYPKRVEYQEIQNPSNNHFLMSYSVASTMQYEPNIVTRGRSSNIFSTPFSAGIFFTEQPSITNEKISEPVHIPVSKSDSLKQNINIPAEERVELVNNLNNFDEVRLQKTDEGEQYAVNEQIERLKRELNDANLDTSESDRDNTNEFNSRKKRDLRDSTGSESSESQEDKSKESVTSKRHTEFQASNIRLKRKNDESNSSRKSSESDSKDSSESQDKTSEVSSKNRKERGLYDSNSDSSESQENEGSNNIREQRDIDNSNSDSSESQEDKKYDKIRERRDIDNTKSESSESDDNIREFTKSKRSTVHFSSNNVRHKRKSNDDDSSSSSSSSNSSSSSDISHSKTKEKEDKKNKSDDSSSSNSSDEKSKENKHDDSDSSNSSSSTNESRESNINQNSDNTESHGNADTTVHKVKRSVGQLEKITQEEKFLVMDLADFAAFSLDNIDDDDHKRVILQILSAKKLKLDGIYYHLVLRLGISQCSENEDDENCREKLFPNLTKICKVLVHVEDDLSNPKVVKSQCQNIKKDNRDRNRTNYSRYRRNALVGAPTSISLNDSRILEFTRDTLTKLDAQSEHLNKHKIVKVVSATSQVVAGAKYKIKVIISLSDCLKNDTKTLEQCEILQNSPVKTCDIEVWDRPWLDKRETTVKCDNDDKEYHFEKTKSKRRRSFSNNILKKENTNMPGGIEEQPSDNQKAKQYLKDILFYLDNESGHSNKLKIEDVLSVEKQVVAGELWRIKARITLSDCLQKEVVDPQLCNNLEGSESRICTFKIWDRPWLPNGREVQTNCENESKPYSFRLKRSVGGSKYIIPSSLNNENAPNPQVLQYLKTGLEYLDSRSIHQTKYVLKNIKHVSRRTVAGVLWHVSAEITLSDCPKQQDIELCDELENSESKTCNFVIWDQTWLSNMQINITCENDDNQYSFSPKNQYHITTFHTEELLTKFNDFMIEHKKNYLSSTEFNYRLKVFRDNLNTIKLLNKYEQGTARYGITQFADLTANEFSKTRGLRTDLRNENEAPFANAVIPDVELPTEFDWRTKEAVTKVKDQGFCGSCWAFSTTGNVEGQYAIKYGKLLEFSEQELVDCDKLDSGCNGGLMDNAYRTIERIGGLESESDYPYDAEDETCHFNKSKVRVQLSGALNISHNEDDMAKWLVKNGPISIAINANAMQFYMGGVSHPWKALCNPKNLDHGVLIVGYGVHKYPLFNRTLPYWIVKNSWGTSWGEQGYYRVFRGDGTCGLNQTPSSAIVA